MARHLAVIVLIVTMIGLQAPLAAAFSSASSLQGFTGLINTPNALVAPQRSFSLGYSDQVDPMWRGEAPWSENYFATFGFLPNLELTAKLTETPGFARDLSASFKWQLPWIPEHLPRLAVGIQDVSGGAPHLRTRYAVASHAFLSRLRLSIGYGLGPDRMEGLFGGAELRVAEWLQLLAEYDGGEAAGAVRLGTPEGMLPGGFRFGAMAKTSFEDQADEWAFAAFMSGPLGRSDPSARCPSVKKTSSVPPQPEVPLPPDLKEVSVADRMDNLRGLHHRLGELGFENLQVGMAGKNTLWVEYENSRYNHNELDGLGLVLGTALNSAGKGVERFVLRVKNEGLPVAEVRGPVAPFRQAFADKAGCLQLPALQRLRPLVEVTPLPPVKRPAGVVLVGGDPHAKSGRATLKLYPGLSTGVGTELGVFDYRLGLKSDLFLHLWRGATFRLSGDVPIAWSDDYEEGRFFNRDGEATEPRVERILLNQAWPLAPRLISLVSVGQFRRNLEGGVHETVWLPGDGSNRLRLRLGLVEDAAGERQQSVLLSYRYHHAPLDLQLEATVGRYMLGDQGFGLELKRFFGDTAIGFFYIDTEERIGGIRLSLPLTPRRDMAPRRVQVRGTERWSYGLQTVLTEEGGRNPLRFDVGILPETEYTLETNFLNGGRINQGYLRRHLARLFEAYWRWGSH